MIKPDMSMGHNLTQNGNRTQVGGAPAHFGGDDPGSGTQASAPQRITPLSQEQIDARADQIMKEGTEATGIYPGTTPDPMTANKITKRRDYGRTVNEDGSHGYGELGVSYDGESGSSEFNAFMGQGEVSAGRTREETGQKMMAHTNSGDRDSAAFDNLGNAVLRSGEQAQREANDPANIAAANARDTADAAAAKATKKTKPGGVIK